MSDLFSHIIAFLAGLLDLLNLILLPTTPAGLVDWSLLPQQPLKLVTWSALLFLFVPMLGRFVLGLARPTKPRRRAPRADRLAAALFHQQIARAAEADETNEQPDEQPGEKPAGEATG